MSPKISMPGGMGYGRSSFHTHTHTHTIPNVPNCQLYVVAYVVVDVVSSRALGAKQLETTKSYCIDDVRLLLENSSVYSSSKDC